jgi:GlpG protein
MRLIGHLPDEAGATTFSDFLYVQGIANSVESEKEGWAVWIHSEDELPKAREMLEAFRGNPQAPRFRKEARQAKQLREQEEQERAQASQRYFDRERVFERRLPLGLGMVTLGLVLASTVVTLLFTFGLANQFIGALLISRVPTGAPEILHGQVWRLITPIFIHAPLNDFRTYGFLHLVFNMLWLGDLGTMIEQRQGSWRLAWMVLFMAALSNCAQYLISGPNFYGMSGVVYGLLGYVWMKGKFDPGSGLFLHPQTVTMMMIWFFLCLFGVVPHVANTVHTVGLVSGLALGYFSSLRSA